MPVGFGFSLGDFIATIDLLKQVGIALKDNGGARDDYLKTVARLETTKVILSCIANFENGQEDSATYHAIHNLARSIQDDVECFLAKIGQYRSTLGSTGGKRFQAGALSKIKWSQCVTSEVKRLYQDIDSKIASLGLLFDLNLSNISSRQRRDIQFARESILQAIEDRSALSNIQVQHAAHNGLAKQDIDVLARGFQNFTMSHTKATDDLASSMATKDDIRDLRLLLESIPRPQTPNRKQSMTPHEALRFWFVRQLFQLSLPLETVASILRNFYDEVAIILKLFFTSFLICLKDLLLAIPQLMLLYRILQRLPPAISLVLHDNIAFEDALGRMQSLQFQQFKHWNVFETTLRCAFESVPGKHMVMNGNYVLTSRGRLEQLTSRNWSAVVRPGSVIKMAVILTQIFADGRQCPRGCRSATSKVTSTEYRCGTCDLVYAVQNSGKARPNRLARSRESALHDKQPYEEDDQYEFHKAYGVSSQTQNSLLPPTALSLQVETQELKALKRIQLAERSQLELERTGQFCPPGLKPRVNMTRWADQNTLCFQVQVNSIKVTRREDNNFINGTNLLMATGMAEDRQDEISGSETICHVVHESQMYFTGVWIPLERALDHANQETITSRLYPLFLRNLKEFLVSPRGLTSKHYKPKA